MKTIAAVALMLVSVVGAGAQTRATIEASGGVSPGYKMPSLSFGGGIEQPIGRFEAQGGFHFSPTSKDGQSSSKTIRLRAGGILWLTDSFGASGHVTRSWLWTPDYHKAAWYPQAGVVWRGQFLGSGTRLYVHYTFPTGTISHGIESPRLQGPGFRVEARIVDFGPTTMRLFTQLDVLHGLRQGNPLCDGTIGNGSQVGIAPCPRSGYWSGQSITGVIFEFPRRTYTDKW